MGNDTQLMVSIKCLVYNHAPYLRQCLDGFVMQKTNFKFEAVVHDDCSTDGSQEIIKEYAAKYPDIIKPIYETENQYSKHDGSLRRIVDAHLNGKYIAFCEGDDYWTDPNKLQMQVDYMEAHPNCGLTYSNVFTVDANSKTLGIFGERSTFASLLNYNRIPTATVCLRHDTYNSYTKEIEISPYWLMGDLPIWLYCAYKTDIFFFEIPTACYRVLQNSASGRSSHKKREDFLNSNIDICKYFVNHFQQYDKIKLIQKRHIDAILNLSMEYNGIPYTSIPQLFYEYKIYSPFLILKYIILRSSLGRNLYKRASVMRNLKNGRY